MLVEILQIEIMKMYKIIISGGGTGGHIFPAISIADELKSRFSHPDILFVGSRDRMEMVKIPAHGYEIKGLWTVSYTHLTLPTICSV